MGACMGFDLAGYLERVGIGGGEIRADLDELTRLQVAQLCHLTFENMDPLTGVVPDLSADALWQKLVVAGRGGYCFELNGLFGAALEACGFEFSPMLARVRNGAARGGARTHLAYIVTIGGTEFLADCGFGNGAPVFPIQIKFDEKQTIRDETFSFRRDAETGETVLERKTPEGWSGLYGFERIAVQPIDIETANFITARWEKAPFSENLMMMVVTEGGRNSLFNRSFKVTRDGKTHSRQIADFQDFRAVMTGDFRLPDNPALFERVWARIRDR